MGKRKKLSARKDVQDLIKEMDPASCGLRCQTAPVPPEVIKLNDEHKELFLEKFPRDYLRYVPLTTGLTFQRNSASPPLGSTGWRRVRINIF